MESMSTAQRERLTRPAVKSIEDIGRTWGLDDADMAAIVGIDLDTYIEHRRNRATQPLSESTIYTGSALSAIDGMIDTDERPAWRWVKQPIEEAPFDGRTPLEVLRDGDLKTIIGIMKALRKTPEPATASF